MLTILNQHPRDLDIVFNEKEHSYRLKSAPDIAFTSVTTFIKRFFNEFDADSVLAKMARFGALAKKYPNMTMDEVKAAWKEKGRAAAETGTRLHKYIELFFNGVEGEDVKGIDSEVEMFKNWICDLEPKFIPFRTEWVIWDSELKIAGCIDMLFRSERDPRSVYIFDWKKSAAIKHKGYDRPKEPISHLQDCNYTHYCLQLNLYKFLLERNYGLSVEGMFLVVIHGDNAEVQMVPVPPMPDEIQAILAAARN